MGKITNNTKFGLFTILCNAIVFVCFIIAMVFLMKFDKINIQYIEKKPQYERAFDALKVAEQPIRADSATVAHYQYRVDTLTAKPIPSNKNDAKKLTDEISRVTDILNEKIDIKAQNDSILNVRRAYFAPIEEDYKGIQSEVFTAKKTYRLILTITFILFALKVLLFGFWNYKNANNIRQSAKWAKKGSAPFWAFVGWLIPVYNFIKPYSFYSELTNDTVYLLKDRGIVPESFDKDDYSEFYLGLWWGFLLLALVLGMLFINGTFFSTGALFMKLNHFNVILIVTIAWAIYFALESFTIISYNKMNNLLFDNQDKL